ncbi:MAG: hypothetical protein IPI04_04270 [Ignavibacteria bacterium]|nr:hypothetical protein [Ignavibacteria bacterium]
MFKVKLIITIIASVFLVTQGNSFSQEKTITGSFGQTTNPTGNDINPQTGIFKLSAASNLNLRIQRLFNSSLVKKRMYC